MMLAVTAVICVALLKDAERDEAQRASSVAAETTDLIERRVLAYGEVLSGLRALFESERRPSRGRVHAFVRSIQVRARYPGIRALAYAQANLQRRVVISHLDPVIGNELALGYDLASERRRAAAIARTRSTGQLALTAPVRLVQAPDRLGFVMMLAVRSANGPLTSVRTGRLQGVVTAAFDSREFFSAALGPEHDPAALRISDVGRARGTKTAPVTLYASGDFDSGIHAPVRYLEVGGRCLKIELAVAGDGVGAEAAWLVGLIGLVTSALAGWLVLLLGRSQTAAQALAERMTRGLRHEQRFSAALLESLDEGVIACNAEGELTTYNHSTRMMDGLGPEARAVLARALEGEHVQNAELVVGAEEGRQRRLLASGRPIRDEHDRALGAVVSMRDVTGRRAAEEARRAAEERFRRAFEDAGTGMAIVGETDGETDRLLEVNATMCVLSGYAEQDLLAMRFSDLVHPDDLAEAAERRRGLLSGGSAEHAELRLIAAGGEVRWTSLSISLVRDGDGRPAYRIVQAQDVSERKHAEQQLRHLADHDPLTGLLNRRRFEEELARELARAQRHGESGAVLAIDLDHFKFVNDTLGHSAGDELISSVGRLLEARVRRSDVLARLGGDEFALILPRIDEVAARAVAAELLTTIRENAVVNSSKGVRRTTATIGIALLPAAPSGISAEDLLVEADIAMYDAKEEGRDRLAVYDPESDRHARMESRLTWTARLRTALDNGDFTLHAQPIVPLGDTPGPARYELLVRLVSPSGELVPPGTFLYVAERAGLIGELDRWVLAEAIRELAVRQRAGQSVVFEVNLSARSIEDPGVISHIARELAATGADPAGLIVEVTETAAIVNVDRARQFATRLAELGCGFALDDFGSGFASFYYLKHLAFDLLKIDGEFVENLATNTTDQVVVRSIVAIARELGKQTIAEYVGDEETLQLLREYGVDFAQGFYCGRPRPLAETAPRANVVKGAVAESG